jgi:hypothetical protein
VAKNAMDAEIRPARKQLNIPEEGLCGQNHGLALLKRSLELKITILL